MAKALTTHDMLASPTSIIRGTILGTLSQADIDRVVARYWAARDFVRHGAASDVPPFAGDEGPVRRYGLCDRLEARLLYGAHGKPGCLVVTTPAQGPYDRAFERFLVAPHAHDSSHITVVTAGRALFVIVCDDGGTPVLVTAEMRPGSVVLYPAGAVHTFMSDGEFQVASLQARYEEPEDRAFADRASVRLDTLRRMSYETYRRTCAAAKQA